MRMETDMGRALTLDTDVRTLLEHTQTDFDDDVLAKVKGVGETVKSLLLIPKEEMLKDLLIGAGLSVDDAHGVLAALNENFALTLDSDLRKLLELTETLFDDAVLAKVKRIACNVREVLTYSDEDRLKGALLKTGLTVGDVHGILAVLNTYFEPFWSTPAAAYTCVSSLSRVAVAWCFAGGAAGRVATKERLRERF